MDREELYEMSREVLEGTGNTLIRIFEQCAENETVYTIGELFEVAERKLVEMADEIKNIEVVVRTAEIIGAMRQRYSGAVEIDGILFSLVAIYLSRVRDRFAGKEVRKNETES